MKPIHITLLLTIILIAIISSVLYADLNERSINPQPTSGVPVSNGNTSSQSKVPLIYYSNVNDSNHTIGNLRLPLRFTLGNQSQNGTKIHKFSILLNVGDAIGFEFNSTQRIGFNIYAPGLPNVTNGLPSYLWYSENTTHRSYGLIALRRGTYDFTFTSSSEANVTFDAWRVKWDPHDVLFTESGGSSGDFGGMGWEKGLEPLPKSFVVGRTWSNVTWTDQSISFEATLRKDTEIFYGYNATEPVIFNLTSDSGTIISHDDLYSYNRTYTVPSTGKYTFSFDMVQPNTSIVSFRCRAANASSLSYPDQTAALMEDTKYNEVKPTYSFPPAINRTTTITGKLGSSTYPTTKGKVMILRSGNSTQSYILHLGSPSEFIPIPSDCGMMLGNVTLSDLNSAYLGNSTIRITGFPFQLSLNGVVYDLFHVNTAEILGAYPLYAQQSAVLASGSVNDILNGTRQNFPIKFDIGVYSYSGSDEIIVGFVQVFYNCYMRQGATVRISYNATNPVEFGFYTFSDSPGSPVLIPFELGKPSDYIFRESGVQSFEHLYTVPRSGFYTFAFKGFGGKDASIVLDASMVN